MVKRGTGEAQQGAFVLSAYSLLTWGKAEQKKKYNRGSAALYRSLKLKKKREVGMRVRGNSE